MMGLFENLHYCLKNYEITAKWLSEETGICVIKLHRYLYKRNKRLKTKLTRDEVDKIAEYLLIPSKWLLRSNDLEKTFTCITKALKEFSKIVVEENERIIPCLRCDDPFLSLNNNNRICDPCKIKNEIILDVNGIAVATIPKSGDNHRLILPIEPKLIPSTHFGFR